MANLIQEQELFFTAYEPILQNRYMVTIDGMPSYLVRKADLPKLSQPQVKLDHINKQRYVKGKTVWEEMQMEIINPVVPSAAQAIMEWQRLHHEAVTGRDGYAEFYKKDIIFNLLGPVGDKVGEWILKGCQITKLDFGEAKFEGQDPLIITLTIQPDFCELNY